MSADPAPLTWSAQFAVASATRTGSSLPGDKILLPPSALEQLLAAAPVVTTDSNRTHTTAFDPFNPYTFAAERHARAQFQDQHQQLPHPLTFRLVNPDNGRVVHAGIREFSADEGSVVLSSFLRGALGLEDEEGTSSSKTAGATESSDEAVADGVEQLAVNGSLSSARITVHAKQLPKGTFVRLRPLEAGYDPEDWKSLLEEHLRANFTTLTNGEVLVVHGGRAAGGKREEFRFLVDGFKPEGDGICVVDTDLEVDIEALNEEQARETLKRIAAKAQRAPGTAEGSSVGGKLSIFAGQDGQVVEGEYVDYELPSWDRSQGVEITLSAVNEEDEFDLFVSPFSSRQRVRPREDEHVFADLSSRYPKRIRLQPTNIELEEAEALWISIHAYPSESPSDTPKKFHIRASVFDPKAESKSSTNDTQNPGDVQCDNCLQWVPSSSLFLHQNFCLRNNILCPQGCGQVFQKRSPAFQNHWHCPHDSYHGNTPLSHAKHDHIFHTPQTCASCGIEFPSIPTLSQHRTTTCPGKLILCRFCHLQVPQEGDPNEPPNPEVLLSGLSPHELADGARTTECHLCNTIVRLRDMDTHLKHHNFERLSRPAPRVCRNINCGRTLDGVNKTGDTRAGTRKGQGPGNDIGLCSVCFGPLYVSLYDPEGKALRRRIERRYLSQLLTGCGKSWCRNPHCRTGKKNTTGEDKPISTKDGIPLVKPFLGGMDGKGWSTSLHFCVDEGSQRRRGVAEMLAAEKGVDGKGGYGFEWCVAALEAEGGDLDRARGWLKGWAPMRGEVS